MSDLIFVGIVVVFFVVQRSLCPLLREAVGGRHGNNRCRNHRAVALRLFVRGDDPAGKILRN